jgi:nicotinate-nucleotide adenylyltransferase
MPQAQLDPLGAEIERLRRIDRPELVLTRALSPAEAPRSVGLLAGSFDPLTIAHAALAESAGERVALVVLIYAARTLPKEGRVEPPLFAEATRLAVMERFCAARSRLAVGLCSHGLLAEQVVAARARFPSAELKLVMGSDKLLQLLDPKWYAHRARDTVLRSLFSSARVLYATRKGDEKAVRQALQRQGNEQWLSRIDRLAEVPLEVAAISSRGVRELLRGGEDVGHLVPPEVHPLLSHPGGYGRS